MLWSGITTIASLVTKGPRAVLARLLSSALAEHFEVDQDEIESNLLRDAKVVLKNARLRPRKFRSGGGAGGAVLTSSGVVERVEFSWKWFGGGSNSEANEGAEGKASSDVARKPGGIVQDARLTIEGLKFRATVERWEDADEAAKLECLRSSESNAGDVDASTEAEVEERDSYLSRCLQQVIDHLTLRVTDFEFALDPQGGGLGVVIGGTDLELVTISSSHTAKASAAKPPAEDMHVPLQQRISFGSFFADVVERAGAAVEGIDSATKRPLLEPFSYIADVRRVAGKRFVGGIGSGLEVTGRLATEGGVVLHAESEQVTALCTLGSIFAPPQEESGAKSEDHYNDGTITTSPEMPSLEPQPTAAKVDSPGEPEKESATDGISPPSTIHAADASIMSLPLPSLSLVLPDGVRATVPAGVTLRYRTDGRVFSVRGSSGILLDGTPVIALKECTGQRDHETDGSALARWTIDLVGRSVVLERVVDSPVDSGKIARISFQKEPTRRLLASVTKLLKNRSRIELSESIALSSPSNEINTEDLGGPFSLRCRGSIGLRIEGGTPDEWFEATLHASSAVLSADRSTGSYFVSTMHTDGLEIGPFSNGSLNVQLPAMTLSGDGKRLQASKGLFAEADSDNTLTEFKDFLMSYIDLMGILRTDMHTDAPTAQPTLPFAVHVPSVEAKIKKDGAILSAKALMVRADLGFMCDSFRVEDGKGSVIDAIGIKVASDKRAMVESIAECNIAGVARIVSPTTAIQATFRQGSLRVQLPSVRITVQRPKTTAQGAGSDDSISDVSIPFPVNLVAKELVIEDVLGGNTVLSVNNINACAKEDGENILLWNQSTVNVVVERPGNEWVKASLQPFSLSFPKSGGTSLDAVSAFQCKGITLGPSSFGMIVAQLPPLMYHPQNDGLCISKSVEVNIQSIKLLDRLQDFFCDLATEDGVPPKPEEPPEAQPLQLPFPLLISETKVTVVDLNLHAALTSVKVDQSLRVHVVGISAKDSESGAHFSASGVSATVFPTTASIESIDIFHVPGVFELADPVTAAKLDFKDGSAKIDLESLGVVLDTSALSSASEQGHGANEPTMLPFPLRVAVGELVVVASAPEGESFFLRLSDLDLGAEPIADDLLLVQTHSSVCARLENTRGEWVEASISPFQGLLSQSTSKLLELECAKGIAIGPSSLGLLSGQVPSIVMKRGTETLHMGGEVCVTVKSLEVLENLCGFFQAASKIHLASTSATVQSKEKPCYKAFVEELKFSVLDENATARATKICIADEEILCNSIVATHGSGSSASLVGMKACIKQSSLNINSIVTAEVPGIARAAKPIENVTITLQDGVVVISTESIEIVLLKSAIGNTTRQSEATGLSSLPIAIMFRPGRVVISAEKQNSSSVSIRNLEFEARPVGKATSVELHSKTSIRLETSSSVWVEASIDPLVVNLEQSEGEMVMSSLNSTGATFGPCSLGDLRMDIPGAVLMEGGGHNAPVSIPSVALQAQSAELCQELQNMLVQVMDDLFAASEPTNEISIPFAISDLHVNLLDPNAGALLRGVVASGTSISCNTIQFMESSGMEGTATHINLSDIFNSWKRLDIESIDSFSIPGLVTLSNPIPNAHATYDGASISINLSSLELATDDNCESHDERDTSPSADFSLPYPINVYSQMVCIRSKLASNEDAVTLNKMTARLRPDNALSDSPLIGLEVNFSEAQHKLFSMQDFVASAKLSPSRPNEI